MQDTKTQVPEQGELILIPFHHRDVNACELMRIARVVLDRPEPFIQVVNTKDVYDRSGRVTMVRTSGTGPTIPFFEIEIAKRTKKMRLWRLKHTTSKIQREVPNGG